MNGFNRERQIGETFDFNGVTLEVVKCKRQARLGCDCNECYAYTSTTSEHAARMLCNSLGVIGGNCGKIERSDNLDIVYKPKKVTT